MDCGIDALHTDEMLGLRKEERLALHCTQSQSQAQVHLTQSLGSWGNRGCQLVLGVASSRHHPLSELLSKLESVGIGSGEQETNNRAFPGPLLHPQSCD